MEELHIRRRSTMDLGRDSDCLQHHLPDILQRAAQAHQTVGHQITRNIRHKPHNTAFHTITI